MTEITGAPKRSNPPGRPIITSTLSVGQETILLADGLPLPVDRPHPWPFKQEEHSVLAWWRTLPADSLHGADHEHLLKTLRQISVLGSDEEFSTALGGDADAAIGAALAAMPVDKITLQVDIAMTALLGAALNRSSSASLVMAQVIGLTDLPHPFAITLAASWLTYGTHHSAAPDKFGEAAALLWQSFRQRNAVTDEARKDAWPMADPIA